MVSIALCGQEHLANQKLEQRVFGNVKHMTLAEAQALPRPAKRRRGALGTVA